MGVAGARVFRSIWNLKFFMVVTDKPILVIIWQYFGSVNLPNRAVRPILVVGRPNIVLYCSPQAKIFDNL